MIGTVGSFVICFNKMHTEDEMVTTITSIICVSVCVCVCVYVCACV